MQRFAKRVQAARVAAPARHAHSWLRRRGSVGLFRCAGCEVSAVCPGCLRSIDVALWVDQGISGLVLYWCPLHQVDAVELARRAP